MTTLFDPITLNDFDLAYLHILEPIPTIMEAPVNGVAPVAGLIRAVYKGNLIMNGCYDARSGNTALAKGEADAIAFGIPFIANPDLVDRYRQGLTLTESDPDTYYTPGRHGYTDYPIYLAQAV